MAWRRRAGRAWDEQDEAAGKESRAGDGHEGTASTRAAGVRLDELEAILERAKTSVLGEDDISKLKGAVDTLAFLTNELEAKGTSIKRLRNWIFGASTERTSNLFDATADDSSSTGPVDECAQPASPEAPASDAPPADAAASDEPKKKRKGHGRNGAESYTGAEQIVVPHADLGHADRCPFCEKGKLYEQAEPAKLLRVTGMAPLSATRFELQRLRCNLCGEVSTAKPPDGVGEEKYDESATSMIAVLKYGTDRKLCADVLDGFVSSLLRHLRWRVKRLFGLASVSDAQVGAITFVQRHDSALRLAPHFHTLAADGAWVRGEDGELRFLALPEPTAEEVAQLATWVHARLLRTLERHGRLGDLAADEPVLASCYGAAARDLQVLGADPGQRTQKVFGPVRHREPDSGVPVAEVGGINIHAATAVDGRDRRQLERLLRYMARPPVCAERLAVQGDGKVRYSFKSAWRDGTKAVVLAPLDFIARLCALVPPPRFYLVHYHGAFSGGSAVRQDIVPGRAAPSQPKTPIPLFEQGADTLPAQSEQSRHPWSWLLARVFAIDILKCPVRSCPGEMKIVEVAKTPEHAARILAGWPLGARPPTGRNRILARQLALPFVH